MKTIEYTTMDKSSWGEGEWMNEPDKRQFLDEETGYPCLIVRSPTSGSLCGYVGMSESHPFFGKEYDDIPINVHGGLTFSDACQKSSDPAHGICHIADNDNVWWVGFDTAHAFDFMPAMDALMKSIPDFPQLPKLVNLHGEFMDIYRNIDYITAEIKSLARQLKSLEAA